MQVLSKHRDERYNGCRLSLKEQHMTAEDIVRERYPAAEARHIKAVFEMGQRAPTQPEHWAVYPAGGLGHQPIATGPTEEAAWTLAAQKVQALGQ